MPERLVCLALMMAACSSSSAPTNAPAPAPAPADASVQPRCRLDAPIVLAIERVRLPMGSERLSRLELRSDGHLSLWRADEPVVTGCMQPQPLDELRGLIAKADTRKMPPPPIMCAAVPTVQTTVELPAQSKTAIFSGPCGTAVHQSVSALVLRADRLADEASKQGD